MAESTYDLVVLGTGPGGYECAIRSSQLGMKTAVVEKDKLGGVCLNVGCIPTKALLKSAEVMADVEHLDDYGLKLDGTITPEFDRVIGRSRQAAAKMNKGVNFLMDKNDIDVIYGRGRLSGPNTVDVEPSENMDGESVGESRSVEGDHIVVATGARAREIPPLPIDGEDIIEYRTALLQEERPDEMVIVGAGAIGVEFAYFYHHMGTDVTLVEVMDRLVPNEDQDVSQALERSFENAGIEIRTGEQVQEVDTSGDGCTVTIDADGETETIETDQVLSAVGVVGNVENIGLDEVGVAYDNGAIDVDEYYRTSVDGVYAIGDVIGDPWLAHTASHEGILCVEKIAGEDVRPMDYDNVPACTYCQPQIASVGLTEAEAEDEGYEVKVGKFPFSANGKATALGHNEGFVKVVFDAKYGEWLGCHMIGHDVTEMVSEAVTAKKLETTGHEIYDAIHPHPTLSEAIMEAAADAYGRAINI